MPDFAAFDRRGYRTVGVAEGYGAWAPTYEDTVDDDLLRVKPGWEAHRGLPFTYASVWSAA